MFLQGLLVAGPRGEEALKKRSLESRVKVKIPKTPGYTKETSQDASPGLQY